MKRIFPAPAWSVFKRKLKERYEQLTDDDLTAIERNQTEWPDQLQRVLRRSTFELAHLAEEVLEADPRRQCVAFAGNEEWRFGAWLATSIGSSQPARPCRPTTLSKEKARR